MALLMILDVKADEEMRWEIDSEKELSTEDVEFIKNYYPVIYWNDVECKHWAFDTKLPSGRWLENITLHEYKVFKATVY